jgi:hypothetical protein
VEKGIDQGSSIVMESKRCRYACAVCKIVGERDSSWIKVEDFEFLRIVRVMDWHRTGCLVIPVIRRAIEERGGKL